MSKAETAYKSHSKCCGANIKIEHDKYICMKCLNACIAVKEQL